MQEHLKEIIEKNDLKTVFQPIISLQNGRIIGYEALTRGPIDSKYRNPEILFEDAKQSNLLWDLEILCRANAIEAFSGFNSDKFLFLNVDPEIIRDKHFIKGLTKELLSEYNINPMNLIFEITEKTSINDYENFNEVINYYKSQGYKIAIDDVGTGYSGLTTIANTRPYYIKIDKSLIKGISFDNFKKSIVKALVEFVNTANAKIIAEGIEDEVDLYTLIEIGVHYGQGYYIARPSNYVVDSVDLISERIIEKNLKMKKNNFSSCASVEIGEIAREDKGIFPLLPCSELYKFFKDNPNVQGIPVVNAHKKIEGLVMNSSFLSMVGTQYGWSVFMKRPVQLVMDLNPLVVDYHTSLDKVSKIVVSREESKLYDYILVEKDNKYYGVVPIATLLEKTMEHELRIAKYSNPLTGLPGNVVIEDTISRMISEKNDFSLLYFDINDFKAYNDTYGFEKGDKVLIFAAGIIKKYVSSFKDSFVGHVGGDDFVAIVKDQNIKELCKKITDDFDCKISNFYSEDHKSKGYIRCKNRKNKDENYSLMSISIAVIQNIEHYESIFDLTETAAKVKKYCKDESRKVKKSCFLIN